ncbi:serine/threonine protein kinase prp4, putative [Entamoeba histolytica HM-3:IMSS]|uniref:Protein kinase domain containing protein n=4 Tax=Entamoeba histolytica TaxID=5759 RepID=C4M1Q4_ENTH1|nr:protein kinase domain containing protein [Entamoeba histolytica HM-1:IMSS]EAL46498.2 protein kinase domain containing protein [Entamoeba histolytica HM-1:IMSS]EMD46728.1 serine/threonine protein kinase, putative [Entamoeba histolytica KU27]EMS16202.1 serine/threonine protein kinase prp4, putative [Entamoeba histolytica HM-3:IMSS]GAT95160.1 protein kinase domain containing protein [Entamoeba histolytica]|eukprot:XP_651884.2 protein kinase domain containing protein [Entamoeba histolytica HM-1:IMSS]
MFKPVRYTTVNNIKESGICEMATIRYCEVLKETNPQLILPTIKRPLTFPSIPTHNNGLDNEGYEYIAYADGLIGSAYSREGNSCAFNKNSTYRIISSLGKGTFGQVLKCENLYNHQIVAIKVLKNKPCYFRQGMLEIAMLHAANLHNQNNDKHIVRILDHFLFNRHICIVFELLGMNLYDVLRTNKNKGMGFSFTQTIGYQILQALFTLKRESVIHCDLKPENILLIDNRSTIKVIDLGSACFEGSTLYTYIQSRHYRAPEIILGLPYSCSIDMWSFGCVIAELLLGIPIFPGENEYNQLVKIIEMVGMPSTQILDKGSKTTKFFKKIPNNFGSWEYVLLTPQEYSQVNGVPFIENKRYHRYRSLQEFCSGITMHRNGEKKSNDDIYRVRLCDFLQKIFVIDPAQRMTPEQAAQHPLMLSKMQQRGFDWTGNIWGRKIEISMSMDNVIETIFNRPMSQQYLQSQNFNVDRYYQTFIKALNNGIVLNVLHINPFHFKPLKCGLPTKNINSSEDESENDLPSIVNMREVPPRSRSRSMGCFEVEENKITPQENEELPPIDCAPQIQSSRKMVMTPIKNIANAPLRPPKSNPRHGSFSMSPKGTPRQPANITVVL